jgi:hypothetical protein
VVQQLFGNRAAGDGEKKFEYVYINQDGTARELSSDEREYLSQHFHPADSGRPYIKTSYNSQDGWGSQSGFLPRRKLPAWITVKPVNPNYTMPPPMSPTDLVQGGWRNFEATRTKVLQSQREDEERAAHSN